MSGILKNKTVLVTGGAGFIGSNLCERLVKQNNDVICFDNFSTGFRHNIEHLLSLNNFTLIEGDIRDYEMCVKAVTGVDVVLHQAALGSVPRSIEDPITTNEVNISGFLNVLRACQQGGVKRFVYAASSSTYGDSQELPKIESRIGAPLSPYAVTKYVNELYAKVFGDLYGVETIGLRYFNVFGRKQTPDGAYAAAIPKFMKAFISYESPVINGDGEQSRDFTYIDNVIQANELAASTDNKSSLNTVYNVAYGENTTLNQLVPYIKELLSKFDPNIANVEILYGSDRLGDVKHSLASIDKAKEMLDYNPAYSLNMGLDNAIDWYWKFLKLEKQQG
jgi:UDP-N-acetylglucosamine/UDP-N-acetylgalactosamine 4-epimerase